MLDEKQLESLANDIPEIWQQYLKRNKIFFERIRFVVWKNMAKINNGNGKTINSQAAMDKAVKSVCDILRRDRAKGARLYARINMDVLPSIS